jgi:hypothetical protein
VDVEHAAPGTLAVTKALKVIVVLVRYIDASTASDIVYAF